MGDLITEVGRALTRRHNVPGPDRPFLENLGALIEQAGSGRAAGRALGVRESTIRGWLKGSKPRDEGRVQLVALLARDAAAGTRYTDAYNGETGLWIKGFFTASRDSRSRTIRPGREIPTQVMQGILRAWLVGDDDRAERLTKSAISRYYNHFEAISVDAAGFDAHSAPIR